MKVVQKAPAGANFHPAISNHLSENQVMSCFIWSLNTGPTVLVLSKFMLGNFFFISWFTDPPTQIFAF